MEESIEERIQGSVGRTSRRNSFLNIGVMCVHFLLFPSFIICYSRTSSSGEYEGMTSSSSARYTSLFCFLKNQLFLIFLSFNFGIIPFIFQIVAMEVALEAVEGILFFFCLCFPVFFIDFFIGSIFLNKKSSGSGRSSGDPNDDRYLFFCSFFFSLLIFL